MGVGSGMMDGGDLGFEMPGERDEEDDGGIDIVRVDDDLCGVAAWEPSRRPTRLRGA